LFSSTIVSHILWNVKFMVRRRVGGEAFLQPPERDKPPWSGPTRTSRDQKGWPQIAQIDQEVQLL